MSAENSVQICRMAEGWPFVGPQFLVVIVLDGDVDTQYLGEVQRILAMADSYEKAREVVRRVTDPTSPDYVYTEYGDRTGDMYGEEEDGGIRVDRMRLFLIPDPEEPQRW